MLVALALYRAGCCMSSVLDCPGRCCLRTRERQQRAHYAAPDTFVIGLKRGYTDAEAFCQSEYHGHLASIKSQADYDKMMEMATGFTEPLLVGGKLGGKVHELEGMNGRMVPVNVPPAFTWKPSSANGTSVTPLAT